MGQFYSREFDGDPYIDLMRSLPERELVWWAQKVIWLAEGFTFVDHFARSYPRLFQHTCPTCKGAGTLTAPDLLQQGAGRGRGDAVKRLPGGGLAVPGEAPPPGGALGGAPCPWDHEDGWGAKWADWESKLAYYDKATGPLMDEWYEDVLNAGNLEEDTPPVEDDPPGPEVKGTWADDDRLLAKDKKRYAALMRRFGHPYDADATLGYQIVDPTASMGENIWNMAQVYNSLPPELNPLRTGGLAPPGSGADGGEGEGVEGPAEAQQAAIAAFDREVAMEAAIMQNLQAAAQGRPKPHRFKHTAGTIPCEECEGAAWHYSLFPNAATFFGLERPLWMAEVARLDKYWRPTTTARTGQMLPYGEGGLRALLGGEGREEADPLEAITGPAPSSTARYRRDLELLVANPELRDARIRLPPGQDSLVDWLAGGGGAGVEGLVEEGGSEDDRLLGGAAAPLVLASAPSAGPQPQREREQQWARSLVGGRG